MLSARHAVLVFVGGVVGTGMRWGIDTGADNAGINSYAALMLVNSVGAFALGWLLAHPHRPSYLRPLFGVGLLGSFTTFSGYTLATVAGIDSGAAMGAVLFSVGSIVIGLCAAHLGRTLGGTG